MNADGRDVLVLQGAARQWPAFHHPAQGGDLTAVVHVGPDPSAAKYIAVVQGHQPARGDAAVNADHDHFGHVPVQADVVRVEDHDFAVQDNGAHSVLKREGAERGGGGFQPRRHVGQPDGIGMAGRDAALVLADRDDVRRRGRLARGSGRDFVEDLDDPDRDFRRPVGF